MRTEDEIRALLEHIEDAAYDHHWLLSGPITRGLIGAVYSTAIRLLKWVLGELEGVDEITIDTL